MKKIASVLVTACLVSTAAACSSRPADCVDIPGSRAAQILGEKATVMAWGAVRSHVHEAVDGSEVYYVAIRFRSSGYEDEATWLSYGLDGGAESLDAGAEAWSGLPRSSKFDASDARAEDARRCIA